MDFDFAHLKNTLITLFIIIVVLLILATINFIIEGIGLYKMAKKLNEKYAWLAFIPALKYYLIGTMVKDEAKIHNLEIILPLGPFIISVIVGFCRVVSPSFATLSSLFLGAIIYIISIYALILLFKKFAKDYYVTVAILMIVFPVLRSIIILILSFKDPEFKYVEYDDYPEFDTF